MQVWMVKAVPRYCGSPSSITQAENCAESAITVVHQIAATKSSKSGLPPKRKPITRQQLPLMAMAHEVTNVRPTRSAIIPPAIQPAAPQPITRNEANSASDEVV